MLHFLLYTLLVKYFADEAQILVLKNAVLPTVTSPADCVVIRGNRIAEIGLWSTLQAHLTNATTIKDMQGATLLPGLGDAHVHFAATGFLQTALDCSDIKTVGELLGHVEKEAAKKEAGELILGLRLQTLEDGVPSLEGLSHAAPDNPVFIRHITGHGAFANELALRTLEFRPGRPGLVLNEHDTPSGYIIAQAMQTATQKMYTLNAEQVGYANAFRAGAEAAVKQGCTVLHALDDLPAVEALLHVEPYLPTRVLPYAQTFDIDAVEALGLKRIGGCHGMALDGDFDMYTAALGKPYLNFPDRLGMLYHDTEPLEAFILAAQQRGFQCAFHAVGDRAVEQALVAYEKAQHAFPKQTRHRIEHAQLIANNHVERIKEAGIVMSLQPAFNFVWNHLTYYEWIELDRAHTVDPLKTWHAQAIPIAGGSDSTVTDLAPLLGIHAAVNHSRPEECLSVKDAVAMFASGVAYATFDEDKRGHIQTGLQADITVLAENPFAVDPRTLKDIAVLMTLVDGSIVFER
ncbi:MAG: amidohydrolase [Trueperaceae bacterium]